LIWGGGCRPTTSERKRDAEEGRSCSVFHLCKGRGVSRERAKEIVVQAKPYIKERKEKAPILC